MISIYSYERFKSLDIMILDYFHITAYRHQETFDPGTSYIYKCDLLVSDMPHDVWLMKLTKRSHLYIYGVPGSKVSRCL